MKKKRRKKEKAQSEKDDEFVDWVLLIGVEM